MYLHGGIEGVMKVNLYYYASLKMILIYMDIYVHLNIHVRIHVHQYVYLITKFEPNILTFQILI